MAKFERYHPIMTPHFTMDWLTQFKVKDINLLRRQTVPNETIIETAKYVNRQMSTVMHDQSLTWGVAEKQTDVFRGIVQLTPSSRASSSAQLTIVPMTKPDDELVNEIQTYMAGFAKNTFGSSQTELIIK
ncbi:hypothetical protein [Secundilactobacillus folii]|uniref:Uncharacterized protein n=1 Tax=Secundilactobacillus folii TaxID=2678357 RepID=A0A7X2XV17_9LACO|nr:hypothetical protein [Secundilactobacillus folii]MTV82040.1 hypothetical protein [Secundilactobacillus folii]